MFRVYPIDIATRGYLNSSLSVATDGYISTVRLKAGLGAATRQSPKKTSVDIKKILSDDQEILLIVEAIAKFSLN